MTLELRFDNSRMHGTPTVNLISEDGVLVEILGVASVALLPGRRCRVVKYEQPLRVINGAAATTTIEGEYAVTLEPEETT